MDATLKKLKEQAEANSIKKLQSLFSTPDQLEQIEQHVNRVEKKKVFFFLNILKSFKKVVFFFFFF